MNIRIPIIITSIAGPDLQDDTTFDIPDYTALTYMPITENTSITKVYTPPTGNDPPLYPQDINTRWRDKYFYSQINGVNSFVLNMTNFEPYDEEAANPFIVQQPLYELTNTAPLTLRLWNAAGQNFGLSHFWTVEGSSNNPTLYETFRLFCNANYTFTNSFLLPPKNNDWLGPETGISTFDNTLIERSYRELETVVDHGHLMGDRRQIFGRFVKIHMAYDDPSEIGPTCPEEDDFIALVVYAKDKDSGEVIADTAKGFILTENWFTLDANDFDDDEEDEPETGLGIRPPRINQFPGRNIGTEFDLGLTRVAPGSTGLKLFYCDNTASINAYLTQYISDHNPEIEDPTDIIKLFGAASSQAIFNNAYSSLIDVYKLPFTPTGSITPSNQFNICGETIAGHDETVLPTLYWGWNQQRIIDCGNITLPEIYDLGWTNYAPFTRATIAIPFCGVFEIPINTFMGGSITLQYSVDCLTGSCTAYLFGVDRDQHSTLIGTFAGDMKLPVPLGITAANTSIIGQALRGGVSSLGKAMTFGNSALFGSNAQPFTNTSAGTPNTYMYGNQAFQSPTSIKTGVNTSAGNAGAIAGMGLQMISDAGQVASDIRGAQVELSSVIGQIGAASGWNNFPIPYVRLDCPVIKEPSAYKRMIGRPANITISIREIDDNTFCKAKGFIPEITRATANEALEIRRILTTGFYA